MNATIIDVSPRDGLQNEPEILAPAVRVELVRRLLAAGVPLVEVGSFVNPKQVPQMAGTAEVVAGLGLPEDGPAGNRKDAERAEDAENGPGENRSGLNAFSPSASSASLRLGSSSSLTALIPNMRGYELAVAAGMAHVRLVVAASEALNQANFKRSVAESLADFGHVAARATAEGIGFGVAIGASFGCPFEGHVPPERVLGLVTQLVDLGADEIILADTTGMAVPSQVRPLCALVIQRVPALTVHFHNTRNSGYANAYAALEAGVTRFDAALGGIGGCPFAPRAVGNIASEDLVHLLNGMGVATGIDLAALLLVADWLGAQLGKPLPALVGKAGMVYEKVVT